MNTDTSPEGSNQKDKEQLVKVFNKSMALLVYRKCIKNWSHKIMKHWIFARKIFSLSLCFFLILYFLVVLLSISFYVATNFSIFWFSRRCGIYFPVWGSSRKHWFLSHCIENMQHTTYNIADEMKNYWNYENWDFDKFSTPQNLLLQWWQNSSFLPLFLLF